MSKTVLALVIVLVSAAVPRSGIAADLGVSGSRLLVDQRGNGRVLFVVNHDAGVAKGTAPSGRHAPAGLDGTLRLFYTDVPDSVSGAFTMPAPWKKNRGKIARFVNPKAPAGPTAVRSL